MRARDAQRLVHLATAAVLIAYVYLTPAPGSALALAVKVAVLPMLVLSGIVLWKWGTLRRWLRVGARR